MALLFSNSAFAQKPQCEISIDGGVGLSNNSIFNGGLSFSGSIFFPVANKINVGTNLRTDFFSWIPYFNNDCTERLWIYSFDGKAKYTLIVIDTFWSILLNGELGLTVIDPAKKSAHGSSTLYFPVNNKYGYNFGGGMSLHGQLSRNVGFSLFLDYRFVKILTKDKDMGNETINYDYHIIYPGVEVTYLF